MKAPVVYFKNYMLRDINLQDAADMYEYGSDMDVVATLNWGPYTAPSEAVYSIKSFFLTRPKKGLPVGYAIVDLENNKMIGTADFHTKQADGSYELGYALHKDYWNKGIMTQVVRQMIEIGLYYFGFERIVVGHALSNPKSQRVIEKNGFVFSHDDEKGFYNRFSGSYEPTRWYCHTKETFKK